MEGPDIEQMKKKNHIILKNKNHPVLQRDELKALVSEL